MTPDQSLLQAQLTLGQAESLWGSVLKSVTSLQNGDPCQLWGPANLAPALQQIGSIACTACHQAVLAALAYVAECPAAVPFWQQAVAQTQAACNIGPGCQQWEVTGDAPGTITLDVNGGSVSCMDRNYRGCIGVQLAAAQAAVAAAVQAQRVCRAQAPSPPRPIIRPIPWRPWPIVLGEAGTVGAFKGGFNTPVAPPTIFPVAHPAPVGGTASTQPGSSSAFAWGLGIAVAAVVAALAVDALSHRHAA